MCTKVEEDMIEKCCQTCNKALTDHYLCGKSNKIVRSTDACSDYIPKNDGIMMVKDLYDKFLELDNSGEDLETQKMKFFIFITKKLQEAGYEVTYNYRDLEKFL